MRGRTRRIALIHALYGTGWAVVAGSVGAGPAAALLIGAGVVLVGLSVARLRRPAPPVPADGDAVGRRIAAINVATGVAVVAALLALHRLGSDRLAIAVILAIVAIHFLPLWQLLRRASLGWMALALAVAAAMAAGWGAVGPATLLAAATFLANAARIAASPRRDAD